MKWLLREWLLFNCLDRSNKMCYFLFIIKRYFIFFRSWWVDRIIWRFIHNNLIVRQFIFIILNYWHTFLNDCFLIGAFLWRNIRLFVMISGNGMIVNVVNIKLMIIIDINRLDNILILLIVMRTVIIIFLLIDWWLWISTISS
jgi:hypothetical protein